MMTGCDRPIWAKANIGLKKAFSQMSEVTAQAGKRLEGSRTQRGKEK